MRRFPGKSSSTLPAVARRRGAFLAIAAISLVVCLTFVAFSADIGLTSLTKTRMQNAVDAAALAAALDISHAISTAGEEVGDVFVYARTQARTEAAAVAQMNGVYVDPGADVVFGRRYFDDSSQTYQTDWQAAAIQTNVVKVIARRDNSDSSAPDGQMQSLFGGVGASAGTTLRTEAIAYIQPRDIAVVHDFSRSMNFDSYFTDETTTRLTQAQIEDNLAMIWDDLQPLNLGDLGFTPEYMSTSRSTSGASATVTFRGTSVDVTTNTNLKSVKLYFGSSSTQSFSISGESTKSGHWSGTGSKNGKRITRVDLTIRKVGSSTQTWSLTGINYDSSTIAAAFNLNNVRYPYASGSWSDYFDFVQTNSALPNYGYRDMYGGMTFLCYIMKEKPAYSQTKDLWKTRHYPFHAIKQGHELLCRFLTELGFDDHIGMVSYDNNHRIETTINDNNPDLPYVDISANPLTIDYEAVRKLMHYKQAAHYSSATNMGGGVLDAIELLDNHARAGSQPQIILMTDGNSNTMDRGESSTLPSDWNWNEMFDYDGDGRADYTTSDSQARYVLKLVKQAVDKQYTVHAISVGADADRDLLRAVAWLGSGEYLDVPGGSSVAEMEDQMRAAFAKIAAAAPAPKLVPSEQ